MTPKFLREFKQLIFYGKDRNSRTIFKIFKIAMLISRRWQDARYSPEYHAFVRPNDRKIRVGC